MSWTYAVEFVYYKRWQLPTLIKFVLRLVSLDVLWQGKVILVLGLVGDTTASIHHPSEASFDVKHSWLVFSQAAHLLVNQYHSVAQTLLVSMQIIVLNIESAKSICDT